MYALALAAPHISLPRQSYSRVGKIDQPFATARLGVRFKPESARMVETVGKLTFMFTEMEKAPRTHVLGPMDPT